jgi:hypothetical protein
MFPLPNKHPVAAAALKKCQRASFVILPHEFNELLIQTMPDRYDRILKEISLELSSTLPSSRNLARCGLFALLVFVFALRSVAASSALACRVLIASRSVAK